MTSKTGKLATQELTEALDFHQQATARLASQVNQLQRVVWLAVSQAPGSKLTLDEATVPPLWKLEKTRDAEGRLILEAQTMEFPAPEKMDALVAKLSGTTLEIGPLQKELGLEAYPPNWLGIYVGDRLVRLPDGRWTPAALAKEQHEQNTPNN